MRAHTKTIYLVAILLLAVLNAKDTDSGFSISDAVARSSAQKTFGILSLPLSVKFTTEIRRRLANNGLSSERIEKLMPDIMQINTAYAPYLELQGHKTVPLIFNDDNEKLLKQIEGLDGILLTGGDTLFELKTITKAGLEYFSVEHEKSGPYLTKTKAIIEKVKHMNDQGRYFPLFGICLGFEAILLAESNFDYPIAFVNQNNTNESVTFTDEPSKLKEQFTNNDINMLKDKRLMFFYHDLGFLPADFNSFPALKDNYTIVAKNTVGKYGEEIAAVEHNAYPIYGTQFHPEKTMFDESDIFVINKSAEAFALAAKFGDVLEASSMDCTNKPEMVDNGEIFEVLVGNLGYAKTFYLLSRNPDVKYLGAEAAAAA